MITQTPHYTIQEFETLISQRENRARLFELINGEIVEKVPTEEHGTIALFIGSELMKHKKLFNINGHIGVEIRYQLPGEDAHSYLPDVAFRFTDEPPITQGAVPHMPDIAVEIQSHGDSLKILQGKAHYYLEHGSQIVWLVLPAQRSVEVHTGDGEYILTEEDDLSGGDILPGFTLSVREIFS